MKDKTKENYQMVEMETLCFESTDIITRSSETPDAPFEE